MIEKKTLAPPDKGSCPSWLLEKPIAHRGYHSGNGECPENSLKAFHRAIQKGYAIELDVHLLADKKVAVFHDENLKRMTGSDTRIIDCESRMLKNWRLLGSDQKIPLLEEVLELVRGRVPLLIELKHKGRAGKPEKALIDTLEAYGGPFAVQSFNSSSLDWLMNNAPHITSGQIVGYCENIIHNVTLFLKNLFYDKICHPSFINYDIRWLSTWIINILKRKDIPVIGWTARSMKEYQMARKWCSNIVFEGFDPLLAANYF